MGLVFKKMQTGEASLATSQQLSKGAEPVKEYPLSRVAFTQISYDAGRLKMSKHRGFLITAVASLLALSSAVSAQPPTGDIELPFKYEKANRIELISVRQEFENDVVREKVRTRATLEVIEADKAGFLFRWTTLETLPDHGTDSDLPPELLALLQSVTKGLRLDYRVTTSGVVTEIVNLPQTRATLSENASRVASQLDAKPETKQLASHIGRMARFYETIPDPVLIGLLGKEIGAFHAVSGKKFNHQHAVTAQSVFNNPFGEGFLPATSTSTIERVAKSPGVLHVRISFRPDLASFIDEVSRSPAKLAQWFGASPSKLPSPAEMKRQLADLSFAQDMEALVEETSGRRHEVHSEKLVSLPGKSLKTNISITVVGGNRTPDSYH